MAKRAKLMPKVEFEKVMEREFRPVRLACGARPSWMQNIPEGLVHSVYASGTLLPGLRYADDVIPSGELIGGIDIYRNAPDDPVELNKDWYAVVRVRETDSYLLVSGPFRDDEHWLDDIPNRLKGAEVLAVPKKSAI